MNPNPVELLLVENPSPVRGILEKILPEGLQNLPEGLQNLPEAVDCAAVEAEGRFWWPEGRFLRPEGWIFSSNPEVLGVGF